MKLQRAMAVIGGVLAALLLAWGAFRLVEEAGKSQSESESLDMYITAGFSPYIINLPLFVAVENDLFNPYEVRLEPFSTTNSLTTAVIRGDVDLASATGTELFLRTNELSPGTLHIALFNAFGKERWAEAFVIPFESDVNEGGMDFLKGKRIGTIPASTAEAYVRFIGQQQGLDFESVERISPDQALVSLSQGSVDALFAVEPQVALALENNLGKILVAGPLGTFIHDPLLAGAHVINGQFKSDRPEAAAVVYRALAEAVNLIDVDPQGALAAAEKYTHLDRAILNRASLPLWVTGCAADKQDLVFMANFFYDSNIVESTRPYYEFVYCPEN